MKNIFLLLLSILCFPVSVFTQNIGIGTNIPAFKLDVKNGSINTDSVYRISSKTVLSIKGTHNTFIGIGADSSITTGSNNTASGYQALYFNTTGEINTAIGTTALYNNTSGYRNVAIGSSALYTNTAGYYNTAVGALALANSTATENTAVGYYTLAFNTTGRQNTASGALALTSNTIGDYNTANGYSALYSNTSSNGNVAIGYHALYSATSGFNTAIGAYTMDGNINGSLNTAIGCYADVSPYNGNISNSIVIGNSAIVDGSNKVRIGNGIITSIGGQVGWSTFSDARYKQNIEEDVPGILFINKLRPVTYTVDSKSLAENYYKLKPGIASSSNNSYRHTGFIAQEVERSALELGFSFSGVDKPQQPNGLYGLRYAEFVVPLVKAVQELSKENDELKNKIKELLERIVAIEKM
ncbi:MAG: tail fiber domain-containing protein [Bacteroidota bacterium]